MGPRTGLTWVGWEVGLVATAWRHGVLEAMTSLHGTSGPTQYEKAVLRGYVESCSNLTWCTNPQGCDRILCRQGLGCGTTCSKCGWASCFNCSFPEVGVLPRRDPHSPLL